MRVARWNRTVFGAAADIEAVTGFVLIVLPHGLIRLLLVASVSIVIGRVAGIALLSLGVGCWLGRQEERGHWALAAMLTYNFLVTIYLTVVGIDADFVGVLLWPAAALHAALTALLVYPLIKTR
jgi:hypothetical protein